MDSTDVAYVLAEKAIRQVFEWHARIDGVTDTQYTAMLCGFDGGDRRVITDGWSSNEYGDCDHPDPSLKNKPGRRSKKLCEPTSKFHIATVDGIVISPKTFSAETLKKFDIFTLRDLLTLYKVQVPSSYQFSMTYCRPVNSVGGTTPFADDPFTTYEHMHVHGKTIKFHHMHSLDAALEYVKERIAGMNASDDSVNNGDLIKQNHRLLQELAEAKAQLAKVKNFFASSL